MTENQKKKTKFRNSSKWKRKKATEKLRADNKDEITLRPLRKGWQLHHNCLDEKEYENLNNSFLCCNRKTHQFVHWLYTYYINDVTIIDRIKAELEEMKKINNRG